MSRPIDQDGLEPHEEADEEENETSAGVVLRSKLVGLVNRISSRISSMSGGGTSTGEVSGRASLAEGEPVCLLSYHKAGLIGRQSLSQEEASHYVAVKGLADDLAVVRKLVLAWKWNGVLLQLCTAFRAALLPAAHQPPPTGNAFPLPRGTGLAALGNGPLSASSCAHHRSSIQDLLSI